jgi:hypothetical protein
MSDDHQLPATYSKLVAAGGPIQAVVPQSIDDMFRMAKAMHISGLVPSTLNSPEKVMIAIMAGAELGIPPFQSVQSFAVINGRPTLWGDGLLAVVLSQGFRVRERMEGEGEGMIAKCELTRPDNGETIERDFSVAQAKRAGLWSKAGPWTQYPQRMLKMRARAFALRDGAADVLRGFQIREEVEDYQDARVETVVDQPKGSGLAARLADQPTQKAGFDVANVAKETTAEARPRGRPRKAAAVSPSNDAGQSADAQPASAGPQETTDHDPETGEIIDAEVEEIGKADDDDFPGDRPTSTAGAQTADAGPASSDSATDASTGSRAETSGPSDTETPSDDGSTDDDAPYTEMVDAMANAAHWLAIKQVLKGYGKTDYWGNDDFRRAALKTAWSRFSDLKNGGEEQTGVASDIALFQLWLNFGAKSSADIDATWPTFYRGTYKGLSDIDQKKINELRTKRKGELG